MTKFKDINFAKIEGYGEAFQPTKRRFKACNGKMIFNVDTFIATSYDWWVFVKKINNKVIFNDYSYSPTTSRHQSYMNCLLHALKIKTYLTVSIRQGLQHFEQEALPTLYEQLFNLEIKLNNPKIKDKSSIKIAIKEVNTDIKKCKQLGCKITNKLIDEIKECCNKTEMERLASLKKESEKRKTEQQLKRQIFNQGIVSSL